MKDFSLTPFLRGKISLYQPEKGYRFNVDSVFLSDFFKPTKENANLIDLGTGSGIIPILISLRYPELKISAVEVQKDFCSLAEKNFKMNGLDVDLKCINVKDVKNAFSPQSFDYVITNPPYIKNYNAINENLKIARSEELATLKDFIKASKFLLKNKGKLFIVFPTYRFVELVKELLENNLIPKRLRLIHPSINEPATNVLVEAQKSVKLGNEKIEKPLIVYKDPRNKVYTEEVQRLLDEFAM